LIDRLTDDDRLMALIRVIDIFRRCICRSNANNGDD